MEPLRIDPYSDLGRIIARMPENEAQKITPKTFEITSQILERLTGLLPTDYDIHPASLTYKDPRYRKILDIARNDYDSLFSKNYYGGYLSDLHKNTDPILASIPDIFPWEENPQYGIPPQIENGEYVDIGPWKNEHDKRINSLMEKSVNNERVILIEDGGIKKPERTLRKLRNRNPEGLLVGRIFDFSRARIVVYSLADILDIFSILSQECEIGKCVGIRNKLLRDHNTNYNLRHQGLTLYFVGNGSKDTDNMVTEIQIVTERMQAISTINHPFDVAKTSTYPRGQQDWNLITHLMGQAHIMDLEDLSETIQNQ